MRLPVRYRSSNGTPLISVTQTLTLVGAINTEWFTPESCWRGSKVHALTEDFDAGRPLIVPSGLEGYIDAYAEFMAIVKPFYAKSEFKVTNTILGLAGTIDRVCTSVFGAPGLIDLKTGDPYPWHKLQLAAYNALHPTGARWACYLKPNGRYRFVQYDDPLDHRRFQYHLAKVRGTVTADGDYWRQIAA